MDPAIASLYGALIGAGAATITVLITSIVTYFSNRESNRLKRYELAFKERIKAFHEILEAVNEANRKIEKFVWLLRSYDDLEIVLQMGLREEEYNVKHQFFDSKNDFMRVYNENRLYFPIEVDREIRKYIDEVLNIPMPYYIDNKEHPEGRQI